MTKRKSRSGSGKPQNKRWNSRIHIFLAFGFLLLILVPLLNKTPNKEVAVKATDAAVKFLYLVDNGKYAESWEASSPHLKAAITGDKWNRQLAEIRQQVGDIIERKRDDISYLDSAGDLPEGEYVVITYDSQFKLRKAVTESITLNLDKNGEWLVAGYYLQ